jgi:hypothetical protein
MVRIAAVSYRPRAPSRRLPPLGHRIKSAGSHLKWHGSVILHASAVSARDDPQDAHRSAHWHMMPSPRHLDVKLPSHLPGDSRGQTSARSQRVPPELLGFAARSSPSRRPDFELAPFRKAGVARKRPRQMRTSQFGVTPTVDSTVGSTRQTPTSACRTAADRAVHQGVSGRMPDLVASEQSLISVRSVVQLHSGPFDSTTRPAWRCDAGRGVVQVDGPLRASAHPPSP